MNSEPSGARAAAGHDCPLCGSKQWSYMFKVHGLTYHSCSNCALVSLTSHGDLAGACETTPYIGETTDTDIERALAYWQQATRAFKLDPDISRILVVAGNSSLMLETGRDLGFKQVTSSPHDLEGLRLLPGSAFDAVLAVLAVEKIADPIEAFRLLHRALKAGGGLLLVAPMMNSWPARFFRDAWTQLRLDNLFLFTTENVQSALWDCGFRRLVVRPDRPRYTLHHILSRARVFPRTWVTRSVRALFGFAPLALLRRIRVPVPSSAFVVTADKIDLGGKKLLSIVMPVYNERKTLLECFERVHAKQVASFDKEIVIVESNSTDGTREIVREIAGRDGVRVIYQDRPRGKGNAVRAGLEVASGDVILIQDADLEYDVEDYDSLVQPIAGHRAAFVLGSRHLGNWKMRKFNDMPLIAAFFNFGHVVFRELLNMLYGQSLKDPFTMFKVFRADCLHGLEFECNRFDFDFEIVIKLIRKGYAPLEVPVNYTARSLNEGKKVSALRDPWTWLWALLKFRFSRIGSSRSP